MNRDTFFQQLRQSRLLTEQDCADLAGRLPESDRAEVLARALVAQGVLTRFQARRLLAGKPGRLVLGQYRLLDRVGRGGMGCVYRAMHTTMGRVVAVKVVSSALVKDANAVALFRREVRAAAQLHHRHIATAYDANEARGTHYLVMEYVEGPSLQGLVKEQGPLPVGLACELIRQAAEALQYAHEQGVVHRDIKPANLLISQAGAGSAGALVLKVVDFGIARVRTDLAGADTIRAKTGSILGTLDYISPEQGNDVHDADIRSDLYSLGCTFYFALTGQVPFPNCYPLEKLCRHLMRQPQPVRSLRPDVPEDVAEIVARLMAKDRGQRYQTPAELVGALSPWCGSDAPPAPPTAEVAPAEPPTESLPERMEPAREVSPEDGWSTVELPLAPPEAPRPLDPGFREKWDHWIAIVAVSVRRRGERRWINPSAFQALQQELVRVCRAQAATADPERQEVFRRVLALVSPWLTPETLTQTDLEIHLSLLRHCQQAKRDIESLMSGSPTQVRDAETTFASILGRFIKKKRSDGPGFKETMRRLYGVEL